MGYNTDFFGELTITPPLTPERAAYINQFSGTRRMKRDAEIAATLPDPVREAVGLPIGEDAGYFTGGGGHYGQGDDASILDYNCPPEGQPGLWCKWCILGTDDAPNSLLAWNEHEKFYDYVEWLEYLIEHFFEPWGHKLTGAIQWSGEEHDDRGTIHVLNNEIRAISDIIVSPEPLWGEPPGAEAKRLELLTKS